MSLSFEKKLILNTGASLPLLELIERPAGEYYAKLDLSGNSILSTVFVESLDPGASVLVRYYDFTTGEQVGEANLLKAHSVLNAGLSANRVLVGNTHDKAYLRATVISGNVKFSVYVTVVSTSASELTDVIVEENQLVNFITDKALAIAGYDVANGVWKFVRLDEDGSIVVRSFTVFENVIDGNDSLTQGEEKILIDKTYINNTRIIKILCETDGYAKLTVKVNDVIWAIKRNSWNDRNIEIDMGAKLLTAGHNIKILGKNQNYYNNNCEFNVFMYEG